MFRLSNVRFKQILDIKDLHIPQNKVTCIVGESGSGKSTILKLLNNLISPDEGDIFFMERPIGDIDPVLLRRRVIMLPQQSVIFGGSVGDNLRIGFKFAELSVPDDKALVEMLKLVRLDKKPEEMPDKFSGGEKQRLALARVLLMNPEVLMLDEPSSSLDENTEGVVIDNIINYVKKNGRTLIMVTHSRKIAASYGETLIEIDKGRVV